MSWFDEQFHCQVLDFFFVLFYYVWFGFLLEFSHSLNFRYDKKHEIPVMRIDFLVDWHLTTSNSMIHSHGYYHLNIVMNLSNFLWFALIFDRSETNRAKYPASDANICECATSTQTEGFCRRIRMWRFNRMYLCYF